MAGSNAATVVVIVTRILAATAQTFLALVLLLFLAAPVWVLAYITFGIFHLLST
jgi:hypothetical protein